MKQLQTKNEETQTKFVKDIESSKQTTSAKLFPKLDDSVDSIILFPGMGGFTEFRAKEDEN